MDQIDSIFMRNFAIVLAVLAGMVVGFIILSRMIGAQVNYSDNVAQAEAIADRIAPVGTVSTRDGGEADVSLHVRACRTGEMTLGRAIGHRLGPVGDLAL